MSIVDDLNKAKQKLSTRNYSLVVVKDNEILFSGKRTGISDLWNVYKNQPHILTEAAVADRVIGRAAAIVLAAGDIMACYGQVLSEGAEEFFRERGIVYEADLKVSAIKQPDSEDLCPLEKITGDIGSIEEGLSEISQFISGADEKREE